MKQVTKITNQNRKIQVYHSNEIVDKREEYKIHFDSIYKGYVDYFVPKETVQSNRPVYGQLSVKMYIPTEKFLANPEKWIEAFKQAHREKFGHHKWYAELELWDKSILVPEEAGC